MELKLRTFSLSVRYWMLSSNCSNEHVAYTLSLPPGKRGQAGRYEAVRLQFECCPGPLSLPPGKRGQAGGMKQLGYSLNVVEVHMLALHTQTLLIIVLLLIRCMYKRLHYNQMHNYKGSSSTEGF